MDSPTLTSRRQSEQNRRFAALCGIAFLVAFLVSWVYVFIFEPWLEPKSRPQPGDGPIAMNSTPFIVVGLRTPPVRKVADAGLADDVEVVGVSIRDRHRAYVLKEMRGPARHIINDLIDEVPVTVTYCDKSECVRLLTSGDHGAPLTIMTGGLFQGELMLFTGEVFYLQKTGKSLRTDVPDLPYEDLPFERTTWKAWREAHPDTEVYVGDVPANQRSPLGEP